jgi:hypothetical protein
MAGEIRILRDQHGAIRARPSIVRGLNTLREPVAVEDFPSAADKGSQEPEHLHPPPRRATLHLDPRATGGSSVTLRLATSRLFRKIGRTAHGQMCFGNREFYLPEGDGGGSAIC